MSKKILSELAELTREHVITGDVAESIRQYYEAKPGKQSNWIIIIFGILGALLVGLGITLIIAHNWDDLPKTIKIMLAFFPLVVSQLLCGFVLLKKADSIAWRESVTTVLFFSLAVCISLISQIFHIQGELSSFLLTWMLLFLPMIYVMRSSIASLLFVVGITYYISEVSFSATPLYSFSIYFLLLLAALPPYWRLLTKKPASNFTLFHNWILPGSLAIALISLGAHLEELLVVAYICLFGIFYLFGKASYFMGQKPIFNGFQIIGNVGTLFILFITSFEWYWDDIFAKTYTLSEFTEAPIFYVLIVLFFVAAASLVWRIKSIGLKNISLFGFAFLFFTVTFFIGLGSAIAAIVLINLYILALGILYILDGSKTNQLVTLNFGLIIITILIICRFFDVDISFVTRGIIFVLLGVGFFVVNYQIIKKRKAHENE